MHFDSPSHEPSTAANCLADWPEALREPKHTAKVRKSLLMMVGKISIIAEPCKMPYRVSRNQENHFEGQRLCLENQEQHDRAPRSSKVLLVKTFQCTLA